MFGNWKVESLRLTIFHATDTAPVGLWRELTGMHPDARDEKPRLGISNERGTAAGNNLTLQVRVQRLDWQIMPVLPLPDINTEKVASLSSVDENVKLLERALSTTFSYTRNLTRLALGVVLFEEADTPAGCIDIISRHIPALSSTISGTTDLIFQINRKRRSMRVSHATINRVCNWQVANIQGGNILVGQTQEPQLRLSTPRLLARLSLDINTVPTNTAISHDNFQKLLTEFIELARVVAVKGDVI